jgi:hypothetical protein
MARIVWRHAQAQPDTYIIDETINDLDALAVYDIDGDGKIDIISADSTAGARKLYWWKQNSPTSWTRYLIDGVNGHFAGDIEATAVLVLEGKLLVIASGQDEGNLNIYTPTTPGAPTGTWTRVTLLADRPWLQSVWAYDIDDDGELELVFTWEGTSVSEGGVHYLDYDGSDPMVAADWTEHIMVTHPSAFWLVREPLDIAGNGRGDLVFSARNLTTRNPASESGVYWIEAPVDPTDPWTLHAVDERNQDWHKVEVGEIFGDGTGLDIIAGDLDNVRSLLAYRHADGYATQMHIPPPDGVTETWNIRRFPSENNLDRWGRSAFLVVHENSYIYIYQFDGAGWNATEWYLYPTLNHPIDGYIAFADLDGDGILEAILPDSETENSKLAWAKIGSTTLAWMPGAPVPGDDVRANIWLSASDLAWPEGEHVPALGDLSGGGITLFNNEEDEQPILVIDEVLGLPVLRFDGNCVLSENTFQMDLRAFTIFFAVRQTGDDASNQGVIVLAPNTGNDSDRLDALSIRTGDTVGQRPTVVAGTPTPLTLTGSDSLMEWAIWMVRKSLGGPARLYKNGVLVTTDTDYTELASANGGGLILGGRYVGGDIVADRRLIGDFGEMVGFPTNLSDAGTDIVGGYFERWGLEWQDLS